jgi:hypothetical protein
MVVESDYRGSTFNLKSSDTNWESVNVEKKHGYASRKQQLPSATREAYVCRGTRGL